MNEGHWRTWLGGLPTSRSQLQDVQADLERQVVRVEARLAALGEGERQAEERAIGIKLNTLNSQLMLIRTRLKVAHAAP